MRDEIRLERVDILGVGGVSLLTCLILLFLGLKFGRTQVLWTDLVVATTLPLSVIAFVALLYIENDAKEPIMLFEFLLRGSVWFADLTRWFTIMARFDFLVCGPACFQVQGYSPTSRGFTLIMGIQVTFLRLMGFI